METIFKYVGQAYRKGVRKVMVFEQLSRDWSSTPGELADAVSWFWEMNRIAFAGLSIRDRLLETLLAFSLFRCKSHEAGGGVFVPKRQSRFQ